MLKTDEIAINGVGVGDYVELTGEKINELLFEATEISVGERFAGPRPTAGDADESAGAESRHDDSNDASGEESDPE